MTASNEQTVPRTKQLVLVTGANGYIAGHVIDQLLRTGYSVRGTIRSDPASSPALDQLRKALGEGLARNLEIIQVADIAAPNAFQDAARGEHLPPYPPSTNYVENRTAFSFSSCVSSNTELHDHQEQVP